MTIHRRRSRGEGTVRLRADGRHEARLPIGHGKYKSYFAATKDEAIRKLRNGRKLQDDNRPIPPENISVARYLADWLEAAKHSKRTSTMASYEETTRRQLIPALGKLRLAHLKTHDVQRWVDRWYDGKASETPGKASTRMCRYACRVLSTALSDALRGGLIAYNPALPKLLTIPTDSNAVKPEIAPLTMDQAATFMDAIHGDDREALYLLSLGLGVRQGEALGLCESDVHLDDRESCADGGLGQPVAPWVSIRQELVYVKEPGDAVGHFELQRLKTAKSVRRLDLPGFVADALRIHLSRQDVKQRQVEKAHRTWGNDWGLVFTRDDGRPLSSSLVTHAFQRKLGSIGLQSKRYYDLRHSTASFLAARGVPVFDIARLLGHSSTQLVNSTYGHWLEEGRQRVAQEMDSMFQPRRTATENAESS